jgi:type I restriction enzyme S subunit
MNSWKRVCIADVCDSVVDCINKTAPIIDEPSPFKMIRTTNIRNGRVNLESVRYVTEETYRQWTRRQVPRKGDILLTREAPMGEVGMLLTDDYVFLGQRIVSYRVDPEKLDNKFLLYAFQSSDLQNQIKAFASGSTVQHMRVPDTKALQIPLPSLPEQKWIVLILDEAFEGIDRAIANTEKNLANARELFESYLSSIFTQKGDEWEEKTLREVSLEFGRGKSKHRPRNDPKLYGDSYPFIQTGDVRNCNHVITKCSQFYSEAGLAQSKLWPRGTICITIAANIAETGILGFDACFPDSVIGIVVNNKITSNDFVEYLLQAVKAKIKAKGKGSAQDNINLATFENERFPFPSLDQQNVVVENLNQLSSETQRLEAIYQQKLAALNELKQSILQKAFTGELTLDTRNQTTKLLEEVAA